MPPDLFHLATGPAEFLLTGVWQGLLLTGAAWIGLKAAPKLAPRTRFLLWMVVFLSAALLPFAGVLAQPESALSSSARATGIPAAHLQAGWAFALAGLWALASLFSLLRLAANGYGLHRLAQTSTELASESLDQELRIILERTKPEHAELQHPIQKTGLMKRRARPITLRLSKLIDTPVVIGFSHPAVVVPEWLWKRLTPSELNQVVMHEIAHLDRRDDWTNLLQKLFRALFPLNPALLWAERQLCREREMACDDTVLDRAVAPREYAACLASLAEKRLLRNAQSLAPGAWRRRSDLAERVQRILKRNRRLSALSTGPVVAVFLVAFLCSGAVLARSPRIVTFLPPPSPVNLASNATAKFIPIQKPLGSAAESAARSLPAARFEQASFRTVVPQAGVPAQSTKRKLRPTLVKRRSHPKHEPRVLDINGLSAPAGAVHPEIIFTVWEISSPLPLFSESGFSYSQITAFRSNDGWIIVQL